MNKYISTFLLAICAGFCIGLGGCVFLALMPTNKALGAILFTVGLFTICTNGFNLFTGKACYIFDNKPSYLFDLLIIWIGNLCGTALISLFVHLTRLSSSFYDAANSLVTVKQGDSLLSLFFLGVICNVLIFIAVNGYKNNPHELGKYLALFFGVTVFILAGTEHSIADMFYFCVAGKMFTADGFLRIAIISLGNVVGGLLLPTANKISDSLIKEDK